MERKKAIELVLAEAFAESGLGALVENSSHLSVERIEALKSSLGFLVGELANDDVFDRQFVSALFVLGNTVPDLLKSINPKSPGYRYTFRKDADDLTILVSALIENWDNWPDWETNPLRVYKFET